MNYKNNTSLILIIVQVSILYNAILLGWKVKKINENKYELSKKLSDLNNFDYDLFINKLLQ